MSHPGGPRQRALRRVRTGTIALATCAAVAGAHAQSAEDGAPPSAPTASADRSAAGGAFLPFTLLARGDGQRAFAHLQGGYDAAQGAAVFDASVEARLMGRVALRAGGSYVGASELRPSFALKVDALRQGRHAVDMAVAAGYEGHGFNRVPALTALVAVGRTIGDTTLLANVAYAQGLESGERYGDLRLAGLRRAAADLHLGFDSRLRVDLERDADEPAGEPEWELLAGPLATYTLGSFALSAGTGVSAIKLRAGGPSQVGVLGNLGLGAAF